MYAYRYKHMKICVNIYIHTHSHRKMSERTKSKTLKIANAAWEGWGIFFLFPFIYSLAFLQGVYSANLLFCPLRISPSFVWGPGPLPTLMMWYLWKWPLNRTSVGPHDCTSDGHVTQARPTRVLPGSREEGHPLLSECKAVGLEEPGTMGPALWGRLAWEFRCRGELCVSSGWSMRL